jgi:hypothetical protein
MSKNLRSHVGGFDARKIRGADEVDVGLLVHQWADCPRPEDVNQIGSRASHGDRNGLSGIGPLYTRRRLANRRMSRESGRPDAVWGPQEGAIPFRGCGCRGTRPSHAQPIADLTSDSGHQTPRISDVFGVELLFVAARTEKSRHPRIPAAMAPCGKRWIVLEP